MVAPATTATMTWGNDLKQCHKHIDRVHQQHLALVDMLHSVLAFSFALASWQDSVDGMLRIEFKREL
jgi:hypothetical protein